MKTRMIFNKAVLNTRRLFSNNFEAEYRKIKQEEISMLRSEVNDLRQTVLKHEIIGTLFGTATLFFVANRFFNEKIEQKKEIEKLITSSFEKRGL